MSSKLILTRFNLTTLALISALLCLMLCSLSFICHGYNINSVINSVEENLIHQGFNPQVHLRSIDGELNVLVVGDWGRDGNYNQSQVAEKVLPDFSI